MTTSPTWATDNRVTSAWCPHCSNQGMVVLDGCDPAGHVSESGAPCPMCQRGQSFDLANYGGRYWADCGDLRTASWQNGATSSHMRRCRFAAPGGEYPCGKPSVDQFCAYHSDPVNRQQRAARALPLDRVVRSAVAGT